METKEKAQAIRAKAQEIRKNWTKPNYAAVPYLNALTQIDDNCKYMCDDAGTLILYLSGNWSTYRTPEAKQLKAELKKLGGIK